MQNSNRIIAGRYMIEGGLVNSWETDETNFRLLGKEGFWTPKFLSLHPLSY